MLLLAGTLDFGRMHALAMGIKCPPLHRVTHIDVFQGAVEELSRVRPGPVLQLPGDLIPEYFQDVIEALRFGPAWGRVESVALIPWGVRGH